MDSNSNILAEQNEGFLDAQTLAARLGSCRQRRNTYTVCCPSHDDQHPSLDITDGEQGTVMTCRAGCDQQRVMGSVCAQAGITPRALFRASMPRRAGFRHPETWRADQPGASTASARAIRAAVARARSGVAIRSLRTSSSR